MIPHRTEPGRSSRIILRRTNRLTITFYMLPTVYTVAPGHHLTLVLTTWDPYRAFLDESFAELDTDKDSEEIDYDYSYVIDNEAIQVKMPVAEE